MSDRDQQFLLWLWISNGCPDIKERKAELYYPKLLDELLNLQP